MDARRLRRIERTDDSAGPAHVVSVYGGDTFTADAMPWPGVTIRTSVRVDGVDSSEIRGECAAEKDKAGIEAAARKSVLDRTRAEPTLTFTGEDGRDIIVKIVE